MKDQHFPLLVLIQWYVIFKTEFKNLAVLSLTEQTIYNNCERGKIRLLAFFV